LVGPAVLFRETKEQRGGARARNMRAKMLRVALPKAFEINLPEAAPEKIIK
jgi:hypothetical protein